MALYLISYDINEKDKDEYEALWAKLRQMKAVKILYSEWLIADEEDRASAIYNQIAPLTKKADRLLVHEIGMTATWDKLLISDDEFRALLDNARF